MAEFSETVNDLQTQLTAIQAAVEGTSQTSLLKKVRPFTGMPSEDVDEWLVKFDFLAEFSNWDETKRLGALVLSFEGPALTWFQTLPEETAGDLSNLFGALKDRFCGKNIDFILRQEL